MTETFALSAHATADWLPLAKAAGFFLATFVLEDAGTVGAGLLLATGEVSWPVAFTVCFFGVWLGDTALYSVARFAGREWFERSSLNKLRDKVTRSERWFAHCGTVILVFSRMLPAARLPTYFAAGFLRLPLPRFLLVTGVASFFWTFIVLLISETFGARLVHWLDAYKHAGLWLLLLGIAGIMAIQFARRAFAKANWRRWQIVRGLGRRDYHAELKQDHPHHSAEG